MLLAKPFKASERAQPTERERESLARQESLLAEGKLIELVDAASALVREKPKLPEARRLLGLALLRLSVREAAEEASSSDAERIPLADALENRRAEAELQIALRLAPREPRMLTALGELFETNGHLEAALDHYERALAFSAYDPQALTGAARLASQMALERRAARHLVDLRQLPNFPIEALLWEAKTYLVLAHAPDVTRKDREVYLNRALRAFDQYIDRKPGLARGFRGKAYVLQQIAKFHGRKLDGDEKVEIRSLYLRAAQLDPKDPVPLFELGCFLESDPELRKLAVEAYREALARNERHVPTLLNLAAALWDSEQREEAKRLYRRVLPLLEDRNEQRAVQALLSR